jgi:hypothetical protein
MCDVSLANGVTDLLDFADIIGPGGKGLSRLKKAGMDQESDGGLDGQDESDGDGDSDLLDSADGVSQEDFEPDVEGDEDSQDASEGVEGDKLSINGVSSP